MPLVNSPRLAPKKLAANRANAQLSGGPITLEGLIRVRDGKIKHGAYAESLKASWQPANEVLLRREDSSFRQAGRLTDMLLKLKREARQVQNSPMNIENEGTSHDVVDNKGRNFLSHDVIDKKGTYPIYPTMCMKTKQLS